MGIKKWSKSRLYMNMAALIFTILAIVSWNFFENKIIFIILFSIAYHLDVRIILGEIVPKFKGKINIYSNYYKMKKFEDVFYKKINVKKWKDKAPTYDLAEFDMANLTLEELVVNMCNSEVVHTTNIIFSLIPLLLSCEFGNLFLLFIISLGSSILDLIFIIIQRYNRPRVMKILEKNKKRA